MILDLCKNYLETLNSGDLESLLSLFDRGAIVDSPLYGEMSATDFYSDLFKDTSNSETKLLDVFESVNSAPTIILHFNYKWTLKNKQVVEFECVDVIELTDEKDKIKKLKIIYDTHPIRNDFEKLKK